MNEKIKNALGKTKEFAVGVKEIAVNVYEERFKNSRLFHVITGVGLGAGAILMATKKDRDILDTEEEFLYKGEENDERNGTRIKVTVREAYSDKNLCAKTNINPHSDDYVINKYGV